MNTLLTIANRYLTARDWKMVAFVKFCLASAGMLLGLFIPSRHRRLAAAGALIVLLCTWVPLMADFCGFAWQECTSKNRSF